MLPRLYIWREREYKFEEPLRWMVQYSLLHQIKYMITFKGIFLLVKWCSNFLFLTFISRFFFFGLFQSHSWWCSGLALGSNLRDHSCRSSGDHMRCLLEIEPGLTSSRARPVLSLAPNWGQIFFWDTPQCSGLLGLLRGHSYQYCGKSLPSQE